MLYLLNHILLYSDWGTRLFLPFLLIVVIPCFHYLLLFWSGLFLFIFSISGLIYSFPILFCLWWCFLKILVYPVLGTAIGKVKSPKRVVLQTSQVSSWGLCPSIYGQNDPGPGSPLFQAGGQHDRRHFLTDWHKKTKHFVLYYWKGADKRASPGDFLYRVTLHIKNAYCVHQHRWNETLLSSSSSHNMKHGGKVDKEGFTMSPLDQNLFQPAICTLAENGNV